MANKEELLRQYLDVSAMFSKHLNKLKSIPSQNFSSIDQKRMATLQNGIDALKSLAQKLNTFSEGDNADVTAEKVAVTKAVETVDELEGEKDDRLKQDDEMIKRLFEAENIVDEEHDFVPVAGADLEDKSFTPEVTSIEDMNEAFSNYVANDYYRRTTGRDNFSLTDIKNGAMSLADDIKTLPANLKSLAAEYPETTRIGKRMAIGAGIGVGANVLLSSIARGFTYNKYVAKCATEGVEPVSRAKYMAQLTRSLKGDVLRGGVAGAAIGLVTDKKGNKALAEKGVDMLNEAETRLMLQDFADASSLAERESLDIMKKSFSLSRGYYPGDNNASFRSWLEGNAEEYFSLRTDIYNNIINEACYDANFDALNAKNIGKGAAIGAGVGLVGGAVLKAIKRNKDYDQYKAEAEANGEKPISRVAYIAKIKELAKAGLKPAVAGAVAGAGIATVGGLIKDRSAYKKEVNKLQDDINEMKGLDDDGYQDYTLMNSTEDGPVVDNGAIEEYQELINNAKKPARGFKATLKNISRKTGLYKGFADEVSIEGVSLDDYEKHGLQHVAKKHMLAGAGAGLVGGALTGLAVKFIKAGKGYKEYKAEAEANGEVPVSRIAYTKAQGGLGKAALIGAGIGAGVGAIGTGIPAYVHNQKMWTRINKIAKNVDGTDEHALKRIGKLASIGLDNTKHFSLKKSVLTGTGIGAGAGALGGALTGLAVKFIKAGKGYKEYKAEAEANGEVPVSRIAYTKAQGGLGKAALIGAGIGAGVGAIGGTGVGTGRYILGLDKPEFVPAGYIAAQYFSKGTEQRKANLRSKINNLTQELNKFKKTKATAEDRAQITRQINFYQGKLDHIEELEAGYATNQKNAESKDRQINYWKARKNLEMAKEQNSRTKLNKNKQDALEREAGYDAVKKARAEYQSKIAKAHNKEIKEMRKALKADHAADIENLKAGHAADIENLKAGHALALKDTANKSALARAKTGYGLGKAWLKKGIMSTGKKGALIGAGAGALGGALTGLAVKFIKAGKGYKEYKAEAEANGEVPVSRIAYTKAQGGLGKAALIGAGIGAGVGALGGAGIGAGVGLHRADKSELDNIDVAKIAAAFFSVYGYYPESSRDILFQNFCYDLVRQGDLQFSDIAYINFDKPAALNKATLISGIGGSVAGGITGKILANKKIKAKEKELGRPLTQEERNAINRKYIGVGAIGGGLVGAGSAFGLQHAANKGNATAQNIVNKIGSGVSTVQNKSSELYNKGKARVEGLKKKGDRFVKRHLHGTSYETQDAHDNYHSKMIQQGQEAMEKMQKGQTLDASDHMAAQHLIQQQQNQGLARKAMILGGAGLAWNVASPLVRQALAKGNEADVVRQLRAEGKTEEEIEQILANYENFSVGNVLVGAGLGAAGGAASGTLWGIGIGALVAAIRAGSSYAEYLAQAKANGEEPVSKKEYLQAKAHYSKHIGTGAKIGAIAGAGLGAAGGALTGHGVNKLGKFLKDVSDRQNTQSTHDLESELNDAIYK